jgi:hypothetical protein
MTMHSNSKRRGDGAVDPVARALTPQRARLGSAVMRAAVLAAVTALALVGGWAVGGPGPGADPMPGGAAAAGTPTTDGNKALARQAFDAFNTGDLDALDALFAPDAVDHFPDPGQGPGREGIKQAFAAFRAGFPDVACPVEDLVAARECRRPAGRWRYRGS